MPPLVPPPASGPDLVAAGAVVVRKGPHGREVLLVHRPKYDDWSFPKGKQDPGEHPTATAAREVLEETGVEIRLGRPLRPQLYAVSGGRAKLVHYWVGHVVGDDDVTTYPVNQEVDDLRWVPLDRAPEHLTYLDDIDLLAQLRESPKRTTPLLVVRHARARKRKNWSGPESRRPLTRVGVLQARALVPVLHAYGVAHVVTSPSTRCVQTVQPYAASQVLPMECLEEISEEDYDPARARAMIEHLVGARQPAVVCSHRPVLPELFGILEVTEEPLDPAELVVCHVRRGRVLATERHLVR